MMQQTGFHDTVEAWADIVQKQWKAEMNKLDVGQTGDLYDSHSKQLMGTGERINMIRFSFLPRGIYVNYGVGREFKRGNRGDIGFSPKRKPKRWFSGIIYRETHALSRILAEKYSHQGVAAIVNAIRSAGKQQAQGLISPKTSRMLKNEF